MFKVIYIEIIEPMKIDRENPMCLEGSSVAEGTLRYQGFIRIGSDVDLLPGS